MDNHLSFHVLFFFCYMAAQNIKWANSVTHMMFIHVKQSENFQRKFLFNIIGCKVRTKQPGEL